MWSLDRSLQLVFSAKSLIHFNLHVWSSILDLQHSCEARAVFPNDLQPRDHVFNICRADKREEISEHKAWHKSGALLLRITHHWCINKTSTILSIKSDKLFCSSKQEHVRVGDQQILCSVKVVQWAKRFGDHWSRA